LIRGVEVEVVLELLTSDVGVDVEVFDGGRQHLECCCCWLLIRLKRWRGLDEEVLVVCLLEETGRVID
jgi:hypothetical protein